MIDLIRRVAGRPLAITGALWPLVMLAPYVPGLPRPSPSGLTWRQEILVALLFCISLGLLLARIRQPTALSHSAARSRVFLILSLVSFVLWSGASTLWAANPYPAIHHTLVWGAYLIFLLLLEQVARSARLLRASVTMLCVVVLVISLSCIIGFLATPLSLFRENGLGEPLAIAVPLFAALSLGLRQKRAAFFCGLTAVMAWLAMLQMFERATFIAATAGLGLLALIALTLPRFRPQSILRALALFIAFAAAVALQSLPSPLAKDDALVSAPPILSRLQKTSGDDVNTRVRFLFWGAALEMVRERPVTGVGADNYDVAFANARARFASLNPDSPLVQINEGFLAVRAHNEYLQIFAELGIVGCALFLSFIAALLFAAYRALRHARSPLVPGAIASLTAFAISSGASSVSFRWMGSGLLFFFAAALVTHFSGAKADDEKIKTVKFATRSTRRKLAAAFAFSLVMLFAMGAQSLNVLMNGAAQESSNPAQAESRYLSAIFWNPYDAAAHFNYGMWLYYQGRASEAVPHTRYGVENGINTSTCYVYLASAQAEAGDLKASEATLARAIEVYPRSVFLRVRHASALAALGKQEEAQGEYAKALTFDEKVARGWWQLICYGKEAASQAARREPQNIKMPGELLPLEAARFVVDENKRRSPSGCNNNTQAFVSPALTAR
jgi:O-antigen ligase